MRFSLLFKALFRVPVKTLVTFTLLTAVSFILLSRVYEYTAVSREFKQLEEDFKGIGTVELSPPESFWSGGAEFLTSDHYNPGHPDGTWAHTRYAGFKPLTNGDFNL